MDQQQEENLLRDVKALTDHMTMVDDVFRQARLGRNMVLVFECGASGLYYPSDYVSNWGRKYGDGLGPNVCSESLQSNYYVDPPEAGRYVNSVEQIMHPVGHSFAQMDAHLVESGAAADNMAVLMHEDVDMKARAVILYQKQLVNPLSKVSRFKGMSVAQIMFETKKNGGFR